MVSYRSACSVCTPPISRICLSGLSFHSSTSILSCKISTILLLYLFIAANCELILILKNRGKWSQSSFKYLSVFSFIGFFLFPFLLILLRCKCIWPSATPDLLKRYRSLVISLAISGSVLLTMKYYLLLKFYILPPIAAV